MKGLWTEFKNFAFKGNMIDLALAVVIGAAFGAVIKSMVDNILMPLLSYVLPNQGGYLAWHIGPLKIGAFLGDVLTFLLIALAVFVLIVKVVGYLMRRVSPPAPPGTKDCPFCLMAVPIRASKCGHCTSELPTTL
jgi:large conductance mechanosensitive channel